MKRYDSYRDSGIDWIGEIPCHWEIKPFKYSMKICNGMDYKHVEKDEGFPVIGSGGIFAYASQYMYDGEALLLGRKGTIDKPIYFNGKFWTVDTMFYAIPKKEVHCKYIYYQSTGFPFDRYSTATALPSMTSRDLNENPICTPPIKEQEAIADYLDRKCASIDGIIATQERRIALLNELKQSVITEAVTRGIDPDARLRDSGIDWIGQIPEHWEVKPIKSEGSFCKGLTFTKAELVDDGIAVISYGQIHSKHNDSVKLKNELMRFIPIELTLNQPNAKVKAGDFIFADTSEDLEGCGNHVLIEDRKYDIYGGYHTIIFHRKNSGQNGKFLAYLFRTDNWRGQLRSKVAGVKVFSITQQILSSTSIILPPKEEQIQIVEYLDKKCTRIDSAIAKAKREIELLREYKQSVITEAVTGKIKVC